MNINENSPQVESFINSIKEMCLINNISLNISNTPKVNYYNFECCGYFESELKKDGRIFPELAVATAMPFNDWFQTFIHESSHADQWLEKSNFWLCTEEYSKYDAWLSGTEYSNDEISNLIYKIILLEADCEMRSIEKIKQYSLPVDIENYSMKANAYLLFHHWMLEQRKWYDAAPYAILDIVEQMPKQMLSLQDYLIKPNEKIIRLFDKCRIS